MSIKATASVRNEYNVKCINELTGEVKHDLTFHNVVTNGIVNSFQYKARSGDNLPRIAIGNGTGTPAQTDTALFNQIKYFSVDTPVHSVVNSNTIKKTISYTIPADASNVYDITEIGVHFYGISNMNYAGWYLSTHALLLDSEGAPITIHKTDLDRVIITCELYYTINFPGFRLCEMEHLLRIFNNVNTAGAIYSTLGFTFSNASILDSENWTWSGQGYYINTAVSTPLALLSSSSDSSSGIDSSTRTYTRNFGTIRLKEYTMPAYIKGITMDSLGVLEFPNEDIFPRQKLAGISVGAGDGTTAEFKCPLNYFIKDTDTVYVNGVALIRGVDYTIDSDNNQDELVELSAGNDATITGGYPETISYSYLRVPLFRRGIAPYYSGLGSFSHRTRARIGADHPLFFDFGEPKKINTLRIAKEAGSTRTYTLYGRNSTDDDWTQVASIKHSTNNYRVKFDTVEYRYMKLTADGWCGFSITNGSTYSGPYDTAFNSLEKCENMLWFLGYVGEGIKFTTPPAEGALITMDAYTDLPFVSPNNVVDLSTDIVFQF